ncbi:hypothetical protein K469DRAFT_682418 [Zopfia rhizophila CBS 207.26]|uniref:Uncharacterized protein n=1 Tax=Zopfia rhizophila CBS 207.26 TaxID=1314779 RepID=A0A6A6EI04_9PEZI|nr:hypothetical protein K469DRAFT_682418 [Zopfia rhizophila CBS 207.26]
MYAVQPRPVEAATQPREAHTEGRRSHVIVRHFLDWTGRHTTDRSGCEPERLTASAAPLRALCVSLQHMPGVEDSFGGGLRACVVSGDGKREAGQDDTGVGNRPSSEGVRGRNLTNCKHGNQGRRQEE